MNDAGRLWDEFQALIIFGTKKCIRSLKTKPDFFEVQMDYFSILWYG